MPSINLNRKTSTYTSRRNSIEHLNRQLSTRATGTNTHRFDIHSPNYHHHHNNHSHHHNQNYDNYSFGDSDGAPIEIQRVPENQVQLTTEQKNEVFTKVITAMNPRIDKNAVRFSYTDGKFILHQTTSQATTHFHMEGNLYHLDSEEAESQKTWIETHTDLAKSLLSEAELMEATNIESPKKSTENEEAKENSNDDSNEQGTEPMEEDEGATVQLKNQFNFSDRSVQTSTLIMREIEVATEAPPTINFSGQVNQWVIADTYMDEFEKILAAREKETGNSKKKHKGSDNDDERLLLSNSNLVFRSTNNGFDPKRCENEADFNELLSSSMNTSNAQQSMQILQSPSLVTELKSIERLIYQNADEKTYLDLKYKEENVADPNTKQDTKKAIADTKSAPPSSSAHSFIPLWKFVYDLTKGMSVTAITFHPKFADLFAVAYGTFEFAGVHSSGSMLASTSTNTSFPQEGFGVISFFTLKNPSYPEFSIVTQNAVCCVEFHPIYHYLVAVGCYDGTVAIYDIRQAKASPQSKGSAPASDQSALERRNNLSVTKPLFIGENPNAKHTDAVWQIHWHDKSTSDSSSSSVAAPPALGASIGSSSTSSYDSVLHFYSIGCDGKMMNWIVSKNDLCGELLIQFSTLPHSHLSMENILNMSSLPVSATTTIGPPVPIEGPLLAVQSHANLSCFHSNPNDKTQYLIGTEEGLIYLLSTQFHAEIKRTFHAHSMPVYAVKWNPFHPGIFLSCSADWQVKLWEIDHPNPVLVFDFPCGISDICWSPYNSTIFAIISYENKLKFYDLSRNKLNSIADLKVKPKLNTKKITKLSINSNLPFFAIGDENGNIFTYKLGNELKKMFATKKEELDGEMEMFRLDTLLIYTNRTFNILPDYIRSFIQRLRLEKQKKTSLIANDKAKAVRPEKSGEEADLG